LAGLLRTHRRGVLEFSDAKAPDPTTGQPDLAKLRAFLAPHPHGARGVELLRSQPALVSYAQVSYPPLHTVTTRHSARTRSGTTTRPDEKPDHR